MIKASIFLLTLLAITGSQTRGMVHRRQRRQLQVGGTDMAHCPLNGALRNCTCTDGSHADMTSNPCPLGSNIDQNTCVCPDGYATSFPPGRAHRLHKICTWPTGETIRSTCKCSDNSIADWSKHPCSNGAYIAKCTCPE